MIEKNLIAKLISKATWQFAKYSEFWIFPPAISLIYAIRISNNEISKVLLFFLRSDPIAFDGDITGVHCMWLHHTIFINFKYEYICERIHSVLPQITFRIFCQFALADKPI